MSRLGEFLLLGSALFAVMVFALAISLFLVWFTNRRRMVPEPFVGRDFAKAGLYWLCICAVMSIGFAGANAIFRPLAERFPGVLESIGGIIALAVLVRAARLRFRA